MSLPPSLWRSCIVLAFLAHMGKGCCHFWNFCLTIAGIYGICWPCFRGGWCDEEVLCLNTWVGGEQEQGEGWRGRSRGYWGNVSHCHGWEHVLGWSTWALGFEGPVMWWQASCLTLSLSFPTSKIRIDHKSRRVHSRIQKYLRSTLKCARCWEYASKRNRPKSLLS